MRVSRSDRNAERALPDSLGAESPDGYKDKGVVIRSIRLVLAYADYSAKPSTCRTPLPI